VRYFSPEVKIQVRLFIGRQITSGLLFWILMKSRLLYRSMELLREGKLRPLSPVELFTISQVIDAFRHLAFEKQFGEAALSFGTSRSDTIPVRTLFPSKESDRRYALSSNEVLIANLRLCSSAMLKCRTRFEQEKHTY